MNKWKPVKEDVKDMDLLRKGDKCGKFNGIPHIFQTNPWWGLFVEVNKEIRKKDKDNKNKGNGEEKEEEEKEKE